MPPAFSDAVIAVIGANGRSGRCLCHALFGLGYRVIAVVRNTQTLEPDIARQSYAVRQADLTQQDTLGPALQGASLVINTAHARFLPAILTATGAPIIALGSTRKFTRWPDAHGMGVMKGEEALQQANRPSVILHPTMIYGAQGENNVQRLAALLKKLPFVPLPNGGSFLVQPINQSDVTRSLVAAVELMVAGKIKTPESIVIAGPEAVTYSGFIRMIASFSGIKPRPIFAVPVWLLLAVSCVMRFIPGFPCIKMDEVRRLSENKNFSIESMKEKLNIYPISLERGLKNLFSKQ